MPFCYYVYTFIDLIQFCTIPGNSPIVLNVHCMQRLVHIIGCENRHRLPLFHQFSKF